MKDCRKRKKKKKRSVRQDSNPWLLDHGSCARPLCHNRCPSASALIIFENFLRVEQDGMGRRRLPGEDNGERWICIETFLFILLLLSRPSFLLSLSLSLSLSFSPSSLTLFTSEASDKEQKRARSGEKEYLVKTRLSSMVRTRQTKTFCQPGKVFFDKAFLLFAITFSLLFISLGLVRQLQLYKYKQSIRNLMFQDSAISGSTKCFYSLQAA